MKKQGGFIPGVRPGKNTADYIDKILTRVTLPASLFLGLIAVLPAILFSNYGGVELFFNVILWWYKFINYSWCSFRYIATN